MSAERATRRCWNNNRVKVSTQSSDTDIVQQDWERGTLVAGLLVAVSFGLMFVIGAWFGW